MTEGEHFIRAKDVTFHLLDPRSGEKTDVAAQEAYNYPMSHLTGVTTYMRSAKNDIDGIGHKASFNVMQLNSDCAFCVATDMFTWARIARPRADDPFLSHHGGGPGKEWSLSYDTYKKFVKRAAQMCGFDPDRFGTHSCRLGGATLLAAAGHPNHYIQKAGRWESLAFLGYIHWAVSSMNAALVSLVNPRVFTNDDMRRLNPGAIFA